MVKAQLHPAGAPGGTGERSMQFIFGHCRQHGVEYLPACGIWVALKPQDLPLQRADCRYEIAHEI